ncbi:myosin-11-like [Euphorbia lathyris]|uniref:myosin-11-like n=1 Tax=Euphorbia lathyris TaxID=212925 RepID=UPI0033143C11
MSCGGYPTRQPLFEVTNGFKLLAIEAMGVKEQEDAVAHKLQTKAAVIIQAYWRCHRASLYYKRLKRGAIVSQTRWRGTIARRELRKLKMASVDSERPRADEIKEDTEKKVEQLQESLQRKLASFLMRIRLEGNMSSPIESTSTFAQIIQTIGHVIETQDDNHTLAYWLSNALTLLLLLQPTLKASGAAGMTPQRRRCHPSSSSTLYRRITQSFHGTPQGVNLSLINGNTSGGVEAKYPALLFKQQLTAYVEKLYTMIRHNLKKEISPLLRLCIQAPRTSRASLVKGVGNTAPQQASIAHWQGIVKGLGNFLNTLKANHVPVFLVRKVFMQTFSFINAQLFNSLLLRHESCSFSNCEYVKAGLVELEHWCYKATDEYAGSSWDELKHIRQAIGFMVIHQKPEKTLDEISHDLCPILSIRQLYRISTMYWDDKYGAHSVSSEVIANMRVLMTEASNNVVSSSFLLDDDSSIPFSLDDLSKSMEQLTYLIEPPRELKI